MPPPQNEATDEQLRTLWVGGISDRVDEETLYELFVNAGPLLSVRIPVDRETKKQKPFAFVLFSHAESLPFAFELFRDVKLYGRPLRMQNKETGLGLGGGGGGGRSYNRSESDRSRRPEEHLSVTLSQHHRSVSMPDNFQQSHQPIHFQQLQQQQYQQHGRTIEVFCNCMYLTAPDSRFFLCSQPHAWHDEHAISWWKSASESNV